MKRLISVIAAIGIFSAGTAVAAPIPTGVTSIGGTSAGDIVSVKMKKRMKKKSMMQSGGMKGGGMQGGGGTPGGQEMKGGTNSPNQGGGR